jgi:hypothetical protein
MRAFLSSKVSGDGCSHFFGRKFRKVSSRIQENSHFLETRLGDRRISPLRASGGSGFVSLCIVRWRFVQATHKAALMAGGSRSFLISISSGRLPAPRKGRPFQAESKEFNRPSRR